MDLKDNLTHQSPASIFVAKASHDPLSIGAYNFIQGNGVDVTPTPGPLLIMGAVAAYRASRNLKRRIQQA